MIIMIDTHSHIFAEEFAEDRAEAIARAKEVGVQKLFLPNIDDTSLDAMLDTCRQNPGYCYPMLGFHPTSVEGPDDIYKVRHMKRHLVEGHSYIAIGEVGLDLYWDKTWLKEQQQVLEEQIQWALEWDLPVVLHCRDAFPELFSLLESYKNTPLTGVFHSFTGTIDEALQLVDYTRFMIGINGVVTFKKSTLPEALKHVPLERLVLETDSPYLAPVPFRGKRNTSLLIPYVIEAIAAVRGMDVEETAQVLFENALRVYRLPG